MKEDFTTKVLGNGGIGLLEKVDDLVLGLLVSDKVEDFTDEVVEDELGVVLLVDGEDLLFFEVD